MWLEFTFIQFLVSVLSSTVIEELAKLAEFPPVLKEKPGEPLGHRKPLGWQRPPEGPVIEYQEALDANQYWKKHVRDHIPLVYRGYIKDSPAISLWTDDYISEKYGELDVLVEHKVEDRTSTSGRMRLRDFLDHYKEEDMYVVSMFPSEMMHEVRAIPSIMCGTFRNYTHESNLWISNGGTRSVVHYDADHNLHCLLSGRKDFIMINNNITTQTNLYFKRKDPGVGSGFSFLDPDSIDMKKFKNIKKVPWTYATLYPGDCIYIPSVYIHQVRGYGRTIAVTTLFTADIQNNFKGDDCTSDILEKYYSMADIPFQWTYKKGDKTIDMGYMNVQIVKNRFRETLNDPDFTTKGKFTKKQFVVFSGLFGAYGRNKTLITQIWSDVFKLRDNDYLDEKTIDKLSLEQWKIYCRAIESPHGVVTNGTEQVFVRPGERHKWENEHPLENDDDQFFTDDERIAKMHADRDPMFDYMSDEEKAEYIERKRREKEKFGIDYEPENQDIGLFSGIHWRINDVPQQYQDSLENGIIPEEYKNEFMNVIPEDIQEIYAHYFEQNRLPQELIEHLNEGYRSSYYQRAKNYLKEEEDDELEKAENTAPLDSFEFEFHDIEDEDTKRDFLKGYLSKEDIKELLKYLPRKLKQYTGEIQKGVVPKEVLRALLRVDEAHFQETVERLRQELGMKKDEL